MLHQEPSRATLKWSLLRVWNGHLPIPTPTWTPSPLVRTRVLGENALARTASNLLPELSRPARPVLSKLTDPPSPIWTGLPLALSTWTELDRSGNQIGRPATSPIGLALFTPVSTP